MQDLLVGYGPKGVRLNRTLPIPASRRWFPRRHGSDTGKAVRLLIPDPAALRAIAPLALGEKVVGINTILGYNHQVIPLLFGDHGGDPVPVPFAHPRQGIALAVALG